METLLMHPNTSPHAWPFPVVNGVATPVPAPAHIPPAPPPLRSPTEEVLKYTLPPTDYQFLDEFTEDAPL
jgi:hypothetical protein